MPLFSSSEELGSDFLRLVNSSVGADVRLIIGEEKVVMHGHSLILQTRSLYFARALNGDWKESSQGAIIKPNIRPAIFERLLQYLYGGRVMIDDDSVMDLIRAADELCLDRLLQGCERHALTIVRRENVLELVRLASEHNLRTLKSECLDFIAANIDQLKRGKAILGLEVDLLKDILSMDQLDLEEIEIWKIAVRWAYFQQGLQDWDQCPLLEFPRGTGCVLVQTHTEDGTPLQYRDDDEDDEDESPLRDNHTRAYSLSEASTLTSGAGAGTIMTTRLPLDGTSASLSLSHSQRSTAGTGGRGRGLDDDDGGFRPLAPSVFQRPATHKVIKLSATVHEELQRHIAPILSAIRFMRIPSADFLRLIEGTGLLPVHLCAKVYRYHSVPSMADPYQVSLRRRMAFSTILSKEQKEIVMDWLQAAIQDAAFYSTPGAGTSSHQRRSLIRNSPPLSASSSSSSSSSSTATGGTTYYYSPLAGATSTSPPTFSHMSNNSTSSHPTGNASNGSASVNLNGTSPPTQSFHRFMSGSSIPVGARQSRSSSMSTSAQGPSTFYSPYTPSPPSGSYSYLGQQNPPGSPLLQPKLSLQYRATRDGFDAANFHMACDQRGPTLTVIKTDNGAVFGGYNNSSWSSHPSGVYSTSRVNFLFTLKSREQPTRENTRFEVKGDGNAAAYNKADYGPTFGIGHDLYLASNCNLSSQSASAMPSSYNGPGASTTTLAGSYYFRVQEYEVFLVQPVPVVNSSVGTHAPA